MMAGSFVHSEGDGNSKPSGLSVSLAGSDGRVLGDGVAGMLVAASPVQVLLKVKWSISGDPFSGDFEH
ncbi:hypothetical protein R6Q59_033930 [Mikania micrantha]